MTKKEILERINNAPSCEERKEQLSIIRIYEEQLTSASRKRVRTLSKIRETFQPCQYPLCDNKKKYFCTQHGFNVCYEHSRACRTLKHFLDRGSK